MDEAYGTCGDRRGVYRILVRNPEGKIPLVISERRREVNINIVLRGRCGGRRPD
jgi:hypothetical protein